jgi:hypothetical protein
LAFHILCEWRESEGERREREKGIRKELKGNRDTPSFPFVSFLLLYHSFGPSAVRTVTITV